MTINTTYSALTGSDYSLNQSSTNGTAATSTSTSATAKTATANAEDTSSLAYMLNLSPAAQNYLSSGVTATSATDLFNQANSSSDLFGSVDGVGDDSSILQQLASATNSNNPAATAALGTFVLSKAQQDKLNAIINKYAGQPYTQDTFDKIQADLTKSGISPDQLAQQAKVNAFNPTLSLLDALNGTNSAGTAVPTDTELAGKIQNYVNAVAAKFDKVAAPDTADTSDAAGADTVSAAS